MFKIVEKKDHNAVIGVFETRERAEWFFTNMNPEYFKRGFYTDKTLTVDDFEVIEK